MKRRAYLFLIAVLFVSCGSKVHIVQPTVEMQDGSIPLATAEPRFSWQYEAEVNNVVQVDYRIIVANSEENAKKGVGDLWDSKIVESNRMLYIPYGGKPLKSRDRCWWKVYTTVTYGEHNRKKSLESEVQHFEISLLSSDDWRAHWIGRDYEDDIVEGHTAIAARYLRKEFTLKGDIDKARLYISGLGVYSAYINGAEVGMTELLKPTLSDYTRRIYFNAYDVTDIVRDGDANAVGVILEGGRFTTVRHDTNYLEWCGINHAAHYGLPQLLMQLEVTYKDGTTDTIVSGEGWKITNRGPIRKSNEFDGETYDARLDLGDWTQPHYNDSQWEDAVVDYDRQNMYREDIYNPRHRVSREYPVQTGSPLPDNYQRPDPMRLLTPQPNPNITEQGLLRPVALFRKGDKWIVDMGQNMVGVMTAAMSGMHNGDTITFRYAELLNADSTLYTANLRSAECTDRYIAAGSTDVWYPMFAYHGFRYVEITGLRGQPNPDDFIGQVLYDEMPMTGTFETSNDIINTVYRNATWGIRGNYRSMPTDCPQRDERMGWTGDRTTGCYGESFVFDNHRLYAKWLQDLEDSQWENGSLPDVAPAYWRNYTDNMTWPGAFITVANMLYIRYGDLEPVRTHYDAMKRWLLHMKKYYLKDGILIRDTYGDWCVPPESPELIHTRDTNRMTWPANLSTPYYYLYCKLMKGFAAKIGNYADTAYFENEMDSVRSAYNARYLDTHHGCYSNNTVTANLLPLAFGMVPEELEDKVFANIIDRTMDDFGGHVSTGVVGIQQLMTTLTEHGRGDLALRIATDTTYPSWGYMVKHGATTIWELWNGDTGDPSMNSGNHVMLLGDLIPWYYSYLGGIRGFNGYSRIILKPYSLEGLQRVTCSYNSVSGRIESNWRRKGDVFEWDILIPPNRTAEVWLPTADGYELLKLTSGRHHLKSTLK
ncbi:MAG: family 78 glycoside hydrolase catalytic domain [Bacteroidales bacterium]|nr:family 78 glycoside hydrolase catalytic domain [Bacteroidales bacterium]